ncbi:esterase [Streptomyces sp. WAC05292]|uniref:FG-GAP-like repeat-containing protein n=1 Tax=Streptomyces sp. WAC05292 TaxID=2487418 RepID=UPI000F73BF59|nr:FG-GAP-like repeat-containing protein [Streptomyces sp. WAC05292]RSS90967.1 esterase [Streptomyces sp. WAC05292]
MSDNLGRRATRTGGAALASAVATIAGLLTAGPASAVTGAPAADGQYAYTARVNIGEGDSTRACSAALVAAQWLLTSTSCFADAPGSPVPAGAPKHKATATLGGTTQDVTLLVPRADRDAVLAKLAQPVAGVAPVEPAAAAAAQGDVVTSAGYGRTKTAWVPGAVHTGSFDTTAVDATTLALTGRGEPGDTLCKGDTGGPVVNASGQLVGLGSRSWQAGCLGTDPAEKRNAATAVRVDGLGDWIRQVLALPGDAQVASGDFNGDGKKDITALYDAGTGTDGKARSSLYTWFSNGSSFHAPVRSWTSSGAFTWAASKLTAGDYNGDGKDDVAVFYNGGKDAQGNNRSLLYTFDSTGTAFASPRNTWTSAGAFSWGASKVASGDFTGDGKDDVAVLYDRGTDSDGKATTSLFTFAGNGAAFDAPRSVWTSPGSFTWAASRLTTGDYNGDRKADIGILYDGGTDGQGVHKTLLFTLNSTGTGFGPARTAWTSGGSFSWGASKVTSGDLTGDGKDDIAVLYDRGVNADGKRTTTLFTFAGNGTDFAAPQAAWTSTGSFSWPVSRLTAGDYNGDGKADVGILYGGGTAADGRPVDTLFSFLSTGSTVQPPASRWTGSVG